MGKRIMWFGVVLIVFIGLNAYLAWLGYRYWQAMLPGAPDWPYAGIYAVLAFGYIASMLLHRVLPYRPYKLLKTIGAYGMGVVFYGLLLTPLAHLAGGLLVWGGMEEGAAIRIAGSAELALLAFLFLKGAWNAWNPVIRRYDLEIDKRAGDREELRIVAASDLHLGTTIGKRHIAKLTKRVAELGPDLVLLPGDVLDDSFEPFVREGMGEELSKLKAPLGVYAVLGNHEYIGGHITDYVAKMREIGIDVLLDRVELVEGAFYIAGRKDHAVERFTGEARQPVEVLLAEADRARPIILLDHQPHKLGAAMEAGVDLMLSGHTHRGQMLPNHLITRRLFELDWGYLRKGAMHAVVSSGFGFWGPPIRLGSRSEVLDIRIAFRGGA
ncbi:metallophosphoesterase [Paenibacillus puerhi]|uniref:metallophosphoesterase n=1 Tax=Paenibacillus puerhi TaxID=2692622 RepID=UPI00135A7D7F|nr:metallophosphoesterase [Paenibacillus puerhi]